MVNSIQFWIDFQKNIWTCCWFQKLHCCWFYALSYHSNSQFCKLFNLNCNSSDKQYYSQQNMMRKVYSQHTFFKHILCYSPHSTALDHILYTEIHCCYGHPSVQKQDLPYILESNPHPFCSFRGLKSQMQFRIACGLDSRSRAEFWKNDGAAVRAVRTIQ
jgi:hypothetical protein